ncbi:uncharacterized protein LOC112593271 [Melanaphis sacchari]|uniref:uncharacterized protein LOC112593271 n=1 Tax=Melanaphis sacchari TaxID=742174 RepID=UPI000DC14E83|nr:uncharacterized protein LOC112593271 [Melanaphis sacchari]
MFLFKIILLVSVFYVSKSKNVYMPNLPVGKYRIVVHTVNPCETTQDLEIQLNLYLSKKARNFTEVLGNITARTVFDDSFSADYNLATWSLSGGWKPNFYVYKGINACSTFKYILGNAWTSVQKAFDFPSDKCPVQPGTFISKGINVKVIEDNRAPKVYFYGKYKMVFKLKNKENKLSACMMSEFDLVRPWEVPENY